jgi:valyl-tRNA synthetase
MVVGQIVGDKLSAQAVAAGCTIEVPLAGLIDLAAERMRLTKLRDKATKDRIVIEKQLSNPDVVARAPAEVIEEKRRQLADLEDQIRKLIAGIDRLN